MPKSKACERLRVLENIIPISPEEQMKFNEILANMMQGKWVDQAIRPIELKEINEE